MNMNQYLSTGALMAGIKAGQLHQGHFNANQFNFLEVSVISKKNGCDIDRRPQGSVNAEAYGKPILLIGRENMNRAVHGDIVVVEVFSEQEWKAPTDEVVDQDCESRFCLSTDNADQSKSYAQE
jgi:exosome complex exonuclease DIS3/RRP44